MDCQEWYKKYVKSNPAAKAKELAWKNRYSDKILFERYLEVLGKDKKIGNFWDFQELKYNDVEGWEQLSLEVLNKPFNYIQIKDSRKAKYYDNIYVVYLEDGSIHNIIKRKPTWRKEGKLDDFDK